MKKVFKKLSLVIAIVMTFSLSSCDLTEQVLKQLNTIFVIRPVEEQFDVYFEQVLKNTLAASPNVIKSYLKDPAAYGIKNYTVGYKGDEFDYPTEEEISGSRMFYSNLGMFDKNLLREDQKLLYETIEYDSELFDSYLNFFYYQEPLSMGDGLHNWYPYTYYDAEFNEKSDVNGYIELLKTTDKYFDSLIAFETQKAENGLFMNINNLESVIKECKTVIDKKSDHQFLTSFDTRINAVKFLTEEEKTEYKEENTALFTDVFLPSYDRLIEFLENFREKAGDWTSIANLPDGNGYLKYLHKSLGLSESPEYYINALDTEVVSSLQIFMEYSDYLTRNNKEFPRDYSPFKTPEKDYEFWKDISKNDFPALPDGTVANFFAQESMPRNAYFEAPKIDDPKTGKIVYNKAAYEEDPDDGFLTMAHEGFPGHLLQIVHAYNMKSPDYSKIMSYRGNSEGWATYAEMYAVKYLALDDIDKEAVRTGRLFNIMLSFRLELGVSYEGWGREEINSFFGLHFEGSINENYLTYIINNPASYAPYVGGYLEIARLKSDLSKNYSAIFSDKLFHEEFLDTGLVPLSVATKRVRERFLEYSTPKQQIAA